MSNKVPLQAVVQTVSYSIKSILVITCIIFNFVLKEIIFASIRRSLCRKSKNCEAGDAQTSSRAYSIVYNGVVDDSVSDVGYGKWAEDPYCSATNPDGVMQLALAENQVSHDLLKEWFSANLKKSLLDEEKDDLGVRGLVSYQCLDGLKDLKIVSSLNILSFTLNSLFYVFICVYLNIFQQYLISDEVFAGSILEGNEFTSISEILNKDSNYDKNRVHIVYGFSKDIPLPGFRTGVLYSYNDEVLSVASKYSRFDSVSVP